MDFTHALAVSVWVGAVVQVNPCGSRKLADTGVSRRTPGYPIRDPLGCAHKTQWLKCRPSAAEVIASSGQPGLLGQRQQKQQVPLLEGGLAVSSAAKHEYWRRGCVRRQNL